MLQVGSSIDYLLSYNRNMIVLGTKTVQIVVAVLNSMNFISGYFHQVSFFISVLCIALSSMPLWLLVPIKMVHEIKKRAKENSGQLDSSSEFLLTKLRSMKKKKQPNAKKQSNAKEVNLIVFENSTQKKN